MSGYSSKQDLYDKVCWEGGIAEFVCGYASAKHLKNTTVGGEKLPEEVIKAAEMMEEGHAVLYEYFSDCEAS